MFPHRTLRHLTILCTTFCCLSQVRSAEPIRIGVAEADITPPEGFLMAGYYHERRATGTHDPLKAKAIVFRGGDEQAAIVVCDLTGVSNDLSAEVRRRAAEQTGIPAANIVVSATHSHTAPDYSRDLYEYLADPSAGDASARYAAKLIGGAVLAVVNAHANARPALIDAGSARQETPVSFNRRFVMQDGSVRTWMRLDSPGVVRAAGPIDPDISIVQVRGAESGRPIGVLTNFALHLDTVGGMLWSGDYPFEIEQSLRGKLGDDVISIFGTGCCGDINHVDPVKTERNKTDFIGQSLAATIEQGLDGLGHIDDPLLRVRSATVPLPLQEVTVADVRHSVDVLKAARAGEKVDFFEQVTAYKTIVLDELRNSPPHVNAAEQINWGLTHRWAGIGERLPVEVHAICLGRDVAIVCLPGEIFVDLGLAIKRGSPFKTTLVIELSNCVETIYVPTRAAYAGGSYEVTNSATQPGSGEMLVEAALRLLRDAAGSLTP